ncbi:MAG: hypothetical protein AB9835_04950 [Eubacteriales bacterium]
MTDAELLEKVKTGLSVSGEYNDASLSIKVQAVKGYMLNAGVSEEQLESPLGVASFDCGCI